MTHLASLRASLALSLLVGLLLTLALPLVVLGHSELDTSDPAEGATVEGPFAGPIVLTFTEPLAQGSRAELVDGAGPVPGASGVDGSTMTLTPDAALAEGDYEIRWTSIGEDGDILRGTIQFTVIAATPEPTASPTPTPSATAEPSTTPSASASATPSPIPVPSAPPDAGNNASGSDVILPIIAALVIIGGLAAFLLRRRDSGSNAT